MGKGAVHFDLWVLHAPKASQDQAAAGFRRSLQLLKAVRRSEAATSDHGKQANSAHPILSIFPSLAEQSRLRRRKGPKT